MFGSRSDVSACAKYQPTTDIAVSAPEPMQFFGRLTTSESHGRHKLARRPVKLGSPTVLILGANGAATSALWDKQAPYLRCPAVGRALDATSSRFEQLVEPEWAVHGSRTPIPILRSYLVPHPAKAGGSNEASSETRRGCYAWIGLRTSPAGTNSEASVVCPVTAPVPHC